MAYNFPNSPSNGDTVVINGSTYTYASATNTWKTAASSGGGGGGDGYGNTGGDGGDGIVIIRTTATALSTTGSPTLTTDGSYNIYTFTVSGTIAF